MTAERDIWGSEAEGPLYGDTTTKSGQQMLWELSRIVVHPPLPIAGAPKRAYGCAFHFLPMVEAEARADLDVERLARALLRVQRFAFAANEDAISDATRIAAAYREDAG